MSKLRVESFTVSPDGFVASHPHSPDAVVTKRCPQFGSR